MWASRDRGWVSVEEMAGREAKEMEGKNGAQSIQTKYKLISFCLDQAAPINPLDLILSPTTKTLAREAHHASELDTQANLRRQGGMEEIHFAKPITGGQEPTCEPPCQLLSSHPGESSPCGHGNLGARITFKEGRDKCRRNTSTSYIWSP